MTRAVEQRPRLRWRATRECLADREEYMRHRGAVVAVDCGALTDSLLGRSRSATERLARAWLSLCIVGAAYRSCFLWGVSVLEKTVYPRIPWVEVLKFLGKFYANRIVGTATGLVAVLDLLDDEVAPSRFCRRNAVICSHFNNTLGNHS